MQANQYEQYCPQLCPEDCKNKEQLLDDKCWNKNNCQKGKKKPPLIKKRIRIYVHSPRYSLDIPPSINCFYVPTYFQIPIIWKALTKKIAINNVSEVVLEAMIEIIVLLAKMSCTNFHKIITTKRNFALISVQISFYWWVIYFSDSKRM